MARGINKVILIGHLGADPETRAMPSGMTVANLRIATTESWKDKQSGEQQERTEWHRVALFGRLGGDRRASTCARARRSTLRAACALASGRTSRATSATPPRSSGTTCRCSVAGAARVAPRVRGRRRRCRGAEAPASQESGGGAAPGGSRSEEFDDDIPF